MTDETALHTGALELQAPTTVYTYTLDPHQVIIGSTVTLLLTIANMDQIAPDVPDTEDQTIVVGIPSPSDALKDPDTATRALTRNPGSIRVVSRTEGWEAVMKDDPQGYYILASGPPIPPGHTVQIDLQQVQVIDCVGAAILPVDEVFSTQHGGVMVLKERAGSSIQEFYTEPGTVTLGKRTMLHWTVSGGTRVIIQPDGIVRPVTGTQVCSDALPMDVLPPTTGYTLELWNDNDTFISQYALAHVGTVSVTLECDQPRPVSMGETVTLTWDSKYAKVPLQFTPSLPGAERPREKGSVTVDPFKYLLPGQTSVTFTLRADGYTRGSDTGFATASVTIPCKVVQVLWFRYTDTTKKEFYFKTANATGAVQIDFPAADSYTLTVDGPGGPIVRHLGPGKFLQVQTMSATPNPAPLNADVTVAYTTLNAVKASLNGQDVPLDIATQTGKSKVRATASTDLILTVTDKDGNSLSSQLPLVVT